MPVTALLDERALRDAVKTWSLSSGREVARLRKQRGWTQPQLGDLTGVAAQTICKVELGLITPTEPVKLAIAFALMVEAVEIWPPMTRHFLASTAQVRAA
jgi:transcriptional regulator with XRE-family HTH domain